MAPMLILLKKIQSQQKILFLILTFCAGIYILSPYVNFQYWLSQGDHGRDLYCFKKTMEGALPYRDYSWLFGPLMPYYYSAFYCLFGISIQSVLLGYCLLALLAGILIYLICSVFISPAMSFICALWYLAFRGAEFFYTYNHIGGIVTLLAAIYFLFRYISEARYINVYAGSASLLALMLIRLNIGLATLVAFFASLCIVDFINKDPYIRKKRRLYIYLAVLMLIIVFLVYWLLLHPLPSHAIHQSLPYSKLQRAEGPVTVFETVSLLWNLAVFNLTVTWPRKIFGIIIMLSAIQCVFLIARNALPKKYTTNIILAFGSLVVFAALNSHEFIASGVFYRTAWVTPIVIIAFFYIMDTGTKKISFPATNFFLLITLFFMSFAHISAMNTTIQSSKTPEHALRIGKNSIYTLQDPRWFKTVNGAVHFIRHNIPENESIFALPFDPLYYFLAEKDSPTRQLIFFEHFNMPPKQEKKIITELENKKVNFVLLSSRHDSLEPGMGVFGKTYCPLLAHYINNNFAEISRFGDWQHPPGWISGHGVKILRRIQH